jgi:hypothetical protein
MTAINGSGGSRGANGANGVGDVGAVGGGQSGKAVALANIPADVKIQAANLLARGKTEEAAAALEPFNPSLAATIRRTDETAVALYATARMA